MKRVFVIVLLLAALTSVSPPALAAHGPPAAENQVLDRAGEWAAQTDAMPGEEIACRAVFTVPGRAGYTARGVFSPGVECVLLTALRQNGQDVNASYYTAVTRHTPEGDAFEIHFAEGFSAAETVQLEIGYTVRLNASAAWGDGENSCAVTLLSAGGEELFGQAAQILTRGVYCYRGVAIPDAAKKSNPLSGACLSLYYDAEQTQRVAFVQTGAAVYMACTGTNCGHSRHDYLLKTPENGVVTIAGLREGTYYLCETMPPRGYSAAADNLALTVDADGRLAVDGTPVPDGMIQIVEQTVGETAAVEERDPLTFYENGCKVLSAVMAVLVLERKRLFC